MNTTLKRSLSTLALSCAAMAHAADRQIGVDPMLSVHWGTLTGGATTPAPQLGNHMLAGFWQRSSGAKAGVGSINTGVVEFQLPENPVICGWIVAWFDETSRNFPGRPGSGNR